MVSMRSTEVVFHSLSSTLITRQKNIQEEEAIGKCVYVTRRLAVQLGSQKGHTGKRNSIIQLAKGGRYGGIGD